MTLMIARIRRVPVPQRRVGRSAVVAHPNTGAPVVLNETATVLWEFIDVWRYANELPVLLSEVYPDTDPEVVAGGVAVALELLEGADLIEHSR